MLNFAHAEDSLLRWHRLLSFRRADRRCGTGDGAAEWRDVVRGDGGRTARWFRAIGLGDCGGAIAGLAVSAIFLRMAALLAARNLFAAFLATLCVGCSLVALSALLLLQSRIAAFIGSGVTQADTVVRALTELHFAGFMLLGCFVSLSLLSLRPYFRIQASRVLAATVLLPLPLYAMVLLGDLLFAPSTAPLPPSTPASLMFFATLSFIFFAIAVHCIRHRYLFLEMTNLRELLDSRVDPAVRARAVRLGGDAIFDS